MIVFDIIGAAAGVAAVGGIFLGVRQLRLTKQQERSDFELRFSDRYDECIKDIPLGVLLDEDPYDRSNDKVRRAFYDYFELCELECHYRHKGAISDATWDDWVSGINANEQKTAFLAAWADLAVAGPEQFERFREEFPKWKDRSSY